MATDIKLPDPGTFTREQLAERWQCEVSLIDRYIENGQLKEGFITFGPDYGYLRDCRFIVCPSNQSIHELIIELNEIEEDEKKNWHEFENSRVVDCPDYLYMPLSDPKDVVNQKNFIVFGKMLFSEDRDDWISCLRDLENNTLFAMKMTFGGLQLVYVKKPKLEDLIIPFEEVLRFEKEHRIRDKSRDVSSTATDRKEKRSKKEREDTNTPSPTTINTAPEEKQPPAPEERIIIRMNEVIRRCGISRPTIYKLMGEGKFPKSVKLTGNRAVGWPEFAIDEWIKERDEKKHKDEKADE